MIKCNERERIAVNMMKDGIDNNTITATINNRYDTNLSNGNNLLIRKAARVLELEKAGEEDPDHISNLGLRYNTAVTLVNNGYTSISQLRSIVDDNLNQLLEISGIHLKRQEEIVYALMEAEPSQPPVTSKIDFDSIVTKSTIDKSDLGSQLLLFVNDLLRDEEVPKYKVNPNTKYPNSNILFTDTAILISVDYIEKLFNKYVEDNFIIGKVDENNYFRFALFQIPNVLCTKTRKTLYGENRLYSFSRYKKLTGNNKNYIKIYKDKMELYGNCNIDIRYKDMDFDIVEKQDLESSGVEPEKAGEQILEEKIDNSPLKEEGLTEEFKKKNDIKSKIGFFFDYCRKLFDNQYILSFSLLNSEETEDRYEFINVSMKGNFVFNPKDISSGEVQMSTSLSDFCKENDYDPKNDLVDFLTHYYRGK